MSSFSLIRLLSCLRSRFPSRLPSRLFYLRRLSSLFGLCSLGCAPNFKRHSAARQPRSIARWPNGSLALGRRLVTALLCLMPVFAAAAEPYRILVSNDDGIDSPLIHALSEGLATLPDVEVVVAAPDTNKSGSSQSTDGGPRTVREVSVDGEFYGYSVDGRPADAVRFGLLHLGKDAPFDLVVSGINRGANVGDVSHLSGTVGAAMEAVMQGVPAIAVSQDTSNVDTGVTVALTKQLVTRYKDGSAPAGVVLSLNVPGGELKGVAVRPMGEAYIASTPYTLSNRIGDMGTYESSYAPQRAEDTASDTYAYQNGYATLTPLKFDWTAHEMIETVESWGITLSD